jgi:hypothetical protein
MAAGLGLLIRHRHAARGDPIAGLKREGPRESPAVEECPVLAVQIPRNPTIALLFDDEMVSRETPVLRKGQAVVGSATERDAIPGELDELDVAPRCDEKESRHLGLTGSWTEPRREGVAQARERARDTPWAPSSRNGLTNHQKTLGTERLRLIVSHSTMTLPPSALNLQYEFHRQR